MLIDLKGRTAIVTGGSRGIGRAIASRLSRSGADVAVLARRTEVVEQTVTELRAETAGRIAGYSCDVGDPGSVEAAMRRLLDEFGPADIVCNNAGSAVRRPIGTLDRATMLADFDLKVFGALQLVQFVLPNMRKNRWGRILNIVSVFGKAPRAGSAPTNVSRAAGIALTKIMAGELAPDNVLVNAICVGAIRSDQWLGFHAREAPEKSFEDYVASRGSDIPLGRIGEAEEVANLACFLASDAASYITGTAINVDGGRSPVV